MPMLRGDERATCPRGDNSPRRQLFAFLRRSGVRARRRVSLGPVSARWQAKLPKLMLLLSALLRPFAFLSSLPDCLQGWVSRQAVIQLHLERLRRHKAPSANDQFGTT